jgi:thymidine kinase
MPLKLILGPMKSGKSFELISNFAHLKYTNIPYAIYQSSRHVRDSGVKSRNGAVLEAQLVKDIAFMPAGRWDL